MSLNIYSPSEILVMLGGVIKLSGYLDGTFLEISKDLAPYSSRRTPDGTVARRYTKDKNYTIKFILSQSSESNDLLTKVSQLDEITQQAFFPLLVKDLSGTSLLFSPFAWIEEIPSQTFGTGIESRTWGIKATSCIENIGGNSDTAGLFDDLVNAVFSAAPLLGQITGDIQIR